MMETMTLKTNLTDQSGNSPRPGTPANVEVTQNLFLISGAQLDGINRMLVKHNNIKQSARSFRAEAKEAFFGPLLEAMRPLLHKGSNPLQLLGPRDLAKTTGGPYDPYAYSISIVLNTATIHIAWEIGIVYGEEKFHGFVSACTGLKVDTSFEVDVSFGLWESLPKMLGKSYSFGGGHDATGETGINFKLVFNTYGKLVGGSVAPGAGWGPAKKPIPVKW